ncbi:ABC transporter permease [Flavobacterium sp.]|uniref:ABC transporter permease n=1 Tax=Flavobacterium sp. TaxID=239 RepID=UPI0026273DD6|nr:ABC transporter permease [Flavobacterium sp.]
MKITNLLNIAWRSISRNKLRTFLTMLGIIIGVAAVIAMIAIGEGSKQSIEGQITGMGSNMVMIIPTSNTNGGTRMDNNSVQSLNESDVIALKKSPHYINAVSPVVAMKGQVVNGSYNWSTTIQGVHPDFLFIRNWPLQEGIAFTDKDVRSASKLCLIGLTVAANLFPNGGVIVGKSIRFKKIPFKIIGILSRKGQNSFGQDQDDVIITPVTTVQKRILATTYYQSIYAAAIDEKSSDSASAEVEKVLRKNHRLRENDDNDFTVRTQSELVNMLTSTSSILTILLTVIAGISLVVGGIGIMNIMYVSVTERTKEIGLRMAIGARGLDILIQFLIEAILISITGGIIGVIIGISATKAVSFFMEWPTLISASSIYVSFLVCFVTGVFFGYYPALKASKLDPIEALRYE